MAVRPGGSSFTIAAYAVAGISHDLAMLGARTCQTHNGPSRQLASGTVEGSWTWNTIEAGVLIVAGTARASRVDIGH